METLDLRRQVIAVLDGEAQNSAGSETVEVVFLSDPARDHYQVFYMGWDGPRRVYHALVHVRLVDGKAYIERDGTEDGIATRLEARGVPREQIVLAFHPPFKRPYTDYATT